MRAALLAILLLAPMAGVLAQESPASPASFLVYRPAADATDPLASALAPPPFDASRLPATRIDRASAASSAPENRPESAPAHYREMQRLVEAAEAEGSPVALVVDGEVSPGALRIDVRVEPEAEEVMLRVVVFEHGVVVDGRAHPYVARFALEPVRATPPASERFEVRLDPAWNVERLGVVAMAERDGRVVQSATWLPRQDAPTEQRAKAPLVEHVTASWCSPCAPADEAFLLLATQRGAAGALPEGARGSYLRAPDGWLWVGLAAGALAAIALVGRRAA